MKKINRAVSAIVNYNGKILLAKKRPESEKVLAGKWHLPGEMNLLKQEKPIPLVNFGNMYEVGFKAYYSDGKSLFILVAHMLD